MVRRYGGKDESTSHSSTKDSAYGSIETSTKNASNKSEKHLSPVDKLSNSSPSRSLSATSLQQKSPSVSTLSSHAQSFQKSEEVFSKELESTRESTSTLHSTGSTSRSNSVQMTRNSSLESNKNVNDVLKETENTNMPNPNNPVITQNGFSPGEQKQEISSTQQTHYISMKSSAYENISHKKGLSKQQNLENNFQNENSQPMDSPYTSMLNIVQGQMQISPHAKESNRNIVNVSVTQFSRKNKK